MSKKRAHIVFSGKVQGVGFRETSQKLASRLSLRGWIKNRPDGKVEMVAEGLEDSIGMLVLLLKEKFEVTDMEESYDRASRMYTEFSVRDDE